MWSKTQTPWNSTSTNIQDTNRQYICLIHSIRPTADSIIHKQIAYITGIGGRTSYHSHIVWENICRWYICPLRAHTHTHSLRWRRPTSRHISCNTPTNSHTPNSMILNTSNRSTHTYATLITPAAATNKPQPKQIQLSCHLRSVRTHPTDTIPYHFYIFSFFVIVLYENK